jgi:peptidylprolyl isomerase
MSKIVPALIILSVVLVAGIGIFLLSNQKSTQTQTDIDINRVLTPQPTNVIITPAPNDQKQSAINMDGFTTTQSGLKLKDEVVGSGAEAKSGNTVTVNYTGTLLNGTKFDSSYDRGTPFSTEIGTGQVIKGWDEGIVGMKVGGKRILVIPPELGYGSQDMGSIPPNSTLVFGVELLDVK